MTLRQLLRKPFVTTAIAAPVDLCGRHIIVTGASAGSLGYASAIQLARWGATVVVTTRHNAQDLVAQMVAERGAAITGNIDGHPLDLSDAASVNKFSQWYQHHYGERLDCLMNNAGVHLDLMSQWKQPTLTADGVEIHWRTNYLGTVHLTDNLLPLLQATGRRFGEARVVNVVSQLHSRGSNALLFDDNRRYESWQAYGLSKLALIHFTRSLHRRFSQSDNLKVYSLHPGGKGGSYTNVADKGLEGHAIIGVLRKLGSPIEKLFMASSDEGAQTQVHCATSSEADSGQYYVDCRVAEASGDSADDTAADRLWNNTNLWLTDLSTKMSA